MPRLGCDDAEQYEAALDDLEEDSKDNQPSKEEEEDDDPEPRVTLGMFFGLAPYPDRRRR